MALCSRCGYDNPESARFCLECGERLGHGGDLFIGTLIVDRFRVDERLGEGGMGSVYLGVDLATDEAVAIKILHPTLARDEKFLTRFENEARLAGSLDHPNIVQVRDTGMVRDTCYIVMDYLPGGDLSDLIRKRRTLSVVESFRIAAQVADALDYAHGQGIIHRDIKPGNIMFTDTDMNGSVVITDFGIAKAMGVKGQTTPGTTMGTPEYMSLEQVRGRELDGRTDIYSLGVVMYQMLTGISPFRREEGGESQGAVSTIAAILDGEAEPIERLRPDIDRRAELVVKKGMAKNRTDRYQSAEELHKAMYKAVGRRALSSDQVGDGGFFRRLFSRTPRVPSVDVLPARVETIPSPPAVTMYGGMGLGRALMVAVLLVLIITGIVATVLLATQTLVLPGYFDIERIARHIDLGGFSRTGGGGGGGSGGGGVVSPPEDGGVTEDVADPGAETPVSPKVEDVPLKADIGPVSVFSFDGEERGDHGVLWARNMAAPLRTSPAVGDGGASPVVFIGSGDGRLYALDVLTGEVLWRADSGGEILSSPLYYKDMVLAGEYNGLLFSWSAIGGDRIWRYRTPGGIFSAPAAADDTVIIGGDEGVISAVDALTGEELWISDVGGDIYAQAAIWGDTLFVVSLDHFLYAVDATYGTNIWRFEAGSALYAAPSTYGGWVFLGDAGGMLYALDAETGALVWRRKTNGSIFSPPAISGETLYVGSADGYIYSLDARTGAAYWRVKTGAAVGSTPFVLTDGVEIGEESDSPNSPAGEAMLFSAGEVAPLGHIEWTGMDDTYDGKAPVEGVVYVGSRDHSLYALDAATGGLLFRFDTGGEVDSSPVVVRLDITVESGNAPDEDIDEAEAPADTVSPEEGGEDGVSAGGEVVTVSKPVIFFGSDDGYLYAIW
ncbi:MAG: PQQ-binding-like beta-propeller repeat protein [Deltaproteobacteria bacterium]|nr:PQQ-binding-like beta-propeller repeat protein [Candidatus Zymogenaceae bacterium]